MKGWEKAKSSQMADVMVKHHAQGELPQWVFFVFGEAQVGGIQPV
jgi:hypothetical protein